MSTQELAGPQEQIERQPNYYLSPEELGQLQEDLVKEVEAVYGKKEDVYAVWIEPHHRLADLVRTQEAKIFPEIPEVMEDYEDQSMFLALLDTRDGLNHVVHAFRISGTGLKDKVLEGAAVEVADENKTGIPLVDDILDSGQDITAQEIKEYYQEHGIKLAKCLSVETNFRIEKVARYNDLPVSQAGYIALFQLAEKQDVSNGDSAIFAHLNTDAINSLSMVGIEYTPIAGRQDLKTPTVGKDGSKDFDDHYSPVAIPASQKNLDIFGQLVPFAAPSLYV